MPIGTGAPTPGPTGATTPALTLLLGLPLLPIVTLVPLAALPKRRFLPGRRPTLRRPRR